MPATLFELQLHCVRPETLGTIVMATFNTLNSCSSCTFAITCLKGRLGDLIASDSGRLKTLGFIERKFTKRTLMLKMNFGSGFYGLWSGLIVKVPSTLVVRVL